MPTESERARSVRSTIQSGDLWPPVVGIGKTLKREDITVESWFYEQGNKSESDYLYCYIRAKDLEKSIKIFRSSTDPLDVYHLSFMDSVVESSEVLELLVDLKG